MGKLERHTIENIAGTVCAIGLGLVAVPFLMHFLGAEAFGLTGFFLTLQGLCTLLDLGMGATLSRELARLRASDATAAEQRDLVYTLQALYWLGAIVVAAGLWLTAPFIAEHWLEPRQLSSETVRSCLRMIAVATALQFPLVFYRCGMLGLHRNGLFNAVFVGTAVLRWPAAVVAVAWSPLPQTFFTAQIVAGAVGTGAATLLLWRCLPSAAQAARFRREVVIRVWRFTSLYSANAIAALTLHQGDKMIVSAMLSLENFGYYSLAQRVASGLYALIVAVNSATFPHFSAAASDDGAALARLYHRGCELMSMLVAPIAAVLVLFSEEILMLWTRSALAAERAHAILALAAAGMLVHAITQGPHYLQVAHGYWRVITVTNLLLFVTVLPAAAFLTDRFGVIGAASISLLLNAGYLLSVPLVHRRFARGELRKWVFDDVLIPISAAFSVAGIAYALMPGRLSPVASLAYIGLAGAAALAGTAAASPDFGRSLRNAIRGRAPRPENA